jgi:hypothetical protein
MPDLINFDEHILAHIISFFTHVEDKHIARLFFVNKFFAKEICKLKLKEEEQLLNLRDLCNYLPYKSFAKVTCMLNFQNEKQLQILVESLVAARQKFKITETGIKYLKMASDAVRYEIRIIRIKRWSMMPITWTRTFIMWLRTTITWVRTFITHVIKTSLILSEER